MKIPSDASPLWKFLHLLCSGVFPLCCELHIEGQENVPATGGCILTCNHSAGPDWLLMGYGSPRQIHYMAKAEIFSWSPFLTRFIRSAGVFPIRRGLGDVGAIQHAVDLVKSGHILGMFPEGTRSYTGELRQGKTGVARIAMLAGVPVVPCAVINSMELLRNLGRPWRRPEIYIKFSKPLRFAGDSTDREAAQQAVNEIMLATAAMMPPHLRGEWGKLLEKDHRNIAS